MQKFKIIKKCIDGIQITGYLVIGEDGKERLLKIEDVITLCRNNLITNAEVILDADTCEYVINIIDGLDSIETMYTSKRNMGLKLIYKTICTDENGVKTCTGYGVQDTKGKIYKIDNNKAWKLASNNNIDNIKALVVDNKKILKSTDGLLLSQLPEMSQ